VTRPTTAWRQWRVRGRQRRLVAERRVGHSRQRVVQVARRRRHQVARRRRDRHGGLAVVCVDITRPTFRFFAKRTSGTGACSPSSCAGRTAAGTRTRPSSAHRDRHAWEASPR
jgi:hypothetical protein